ncbi:MAG: hypothetical protein KME21_25330 [Desmonostoc vinosum HA7617-LM4]|nr:hypothetical protein [Desmonostoc vinosum HA7617-LM4]
MGNWGRGRGDTGTRGRGEIFSRLVSEVEPHPLIFPCLPCLPLTGVGILHSI